MKGALPPSSRWTRLRLRAASSWIFRPGGGVAGERHEVDVVMRGDRRADLVAGAGDHVEDAGRQAGFERQPPSLSVVSGVAVAGLRTTELPAASAGPIFQIAIMNG